MTADGTWLDYADFNYVAHEILFLFQWRGESLRPRYPADHWVASFTLPPVPISFCEQSRDEREREREKTTALVDRFILGAEQSILRPFIWPKGRGGVAGNARGSATMRCRASLIDTCALESKTKKQTTNEKCLEPRDGCCCANSRPAASLFHANFCKFDFIAMRKYSNFWQVNLKKKLKNIQNKL